MEFTSETNSRTQDYALDHGHESGSSGGGIDDVDTSYDEGLDTER